MKTSTIWMIIGWQKSQKMENQISPGHHSWFPKCDVKVEYRRQRRRGTVDEIQNMILKRKKKILIGDFRVHYW